MTLDRVEIAVLREPLRCRFRADAGYARDIVRAVADERQEVNYLFRPYAELLMHARSVHRGIGHRVDERDVLVD